MFDVDGQRLLDDHVVGTIDGLTVVPSLGGDALGPLHPPIVGP